jgi:hypothetical protein
LVLLTSPGQKKSPGERPGLEASLGSQGGAFGQAASENA